MNSKFRVEEIKRLHELSQGFASNKMSEYERAEFNVLNKSFLGIDLVGTLLQELERKDKMLEKCKKSLTYYSKPEFDRVCFLDHATCEEHYGADARQTLDELETQSHE